MLTPARLAYLKNLAERFSKGGARTYYDMTFEYLKHMTPETIIEMIDEIEDSRKASGSGQNEKTSSNSN